MNLIDPEEVEQYESETDLKVVGLTILALCITIALIAWAPDVEAIGAWISSLIN